MTDYRDYQRARRRYHLPAMHALAYLRDRATIARSDLGWYAEPDYDEPGSLVVYIGADDERGTINSVCGVELEHSVSDHGNTNYDDDNPHLVGIVADMIRDYEGTP